MRKLLDMANRHGIGIAVVCCALACGSVAVLSGYYTGQDRSDLWTASGATATFIAAAVALWIGTEERRAKRDEDIARAKVAAVLNEPILKRLVSHLDLLRVQLDDCETLLSAANIKANAAHAERILAVIEHFREPISLDEINSIATLSPEAAYTIARARSYMRLLAAEITVGIRRARDNSRGGSSYQPPGVQWRTWVGEALENAQRAFRWCESVSLTFRG